MKIGMTVGHTQETVAEIAEYTAQSEQLGLDFAGFPDSQSVFRDLYCSLTAAALATKSIGLAVATTNPLTRLPLTTASGIASVDELSGGRVTLTVGRGFSSVTSAGLSPAKPAELAKGVDEIRRAFRPHTSVEGEPFGLQWVKRAVPTLVACSTGGPLGLKVAAQHGDGALLMGEVGNVAVIKQTVAALNRMRAEGPRAGEPFEVWIYTPAFVSDDADEAASAVSMMVSSNAVAAYSSPRAVVPAEIKDRMDELTRGYAFEAHASTTDLRNADLMRKLGIEKELTSRFAICGTKAEVATRLNDLEAEGVSAIVVSGSVPNKSDLLERLASLKRHIAQSPTSSTT